jgi:hypothetical protein
MISMDRQFVFHKDILARTLNAAKLFGIPLIIAVIVPVLLVEPARIFIVFLSACLVLYGILRMGQAALGRNSRAVVRYLQNQNALQDRRRALGVISMIFLLIAGSHMLSELKAVFEDCNCESPAAAVRRLNTLSDLEFTGLLAHSGILITATVGAIWGFAALIGHPIQRIWRLFRSHGQKGGNGRIF